MRIPVLALTSVFAFGLLSAPLLLQEKGGEEDAPEEGPSEKGGAEEKQSARKESERGNLSV